MNTTGFLASGNSKSCKAMMDQLEYHVTCFTYTHSLTHMHTQCQLCLTALGRASWLGRHINWTIRTRRSDKNIPGTIHVNVQLSEKHFLSLILKTKKKKEIFEEEGRASTGRDMETSCFSCKQGQESASEPHRPSLSLPESLISRSPSLTGPLALGSAGLGPQLNTLALSP